MTFVELVVVMSIFAIISTISIFEYKEFQYIVDLKSFTNDIALKAVEAQKNSINGKLIDGTLDPQIWVPSYGIKFDTNISNNAFISYVNLDNSLSALDFGCDTYTCTAVDFNGSYHSSNQSEETLEKLTINKGFLIQEIKIRGTQLSSFGCPPLPQPPTSVTNLQFLFQRPDSKSLFFVSGLQNCDFATIQYADIVIIAPNNKTGTVRMHASGQIQLIN